MFTPRDPSEDLSKQVLDQFRIFANAERNRINQRKRLQALLDLEARRSRASTTNELLIFSKTFKANSPLPRQLVDVVTNDALQQKHILEHDLSTPPRQSSTWTGTVAPNTATTLQTLSNAAHNESSLLPALNLTTPRHEVANTRLFRSMNVTPSVSSAASAFNGATSNGQSLLSKWTKSTAPTSFLGDDVNKDDIAVVRADVPLPSIKEEVLPSDAALISVQGSNQTHDTQSLASAESVVVLTQEQRKDAANGFTRALIEKVSYRHLIPQTSSTPSTRFCQSLGRLVFEYTEQVKQTTPRTHRLQRQAVKQIQILRNDISRQCAAALADITIGPHEQRTHPEITKRAAAAHLTEKTWEEKVGDWNVLPEAETNNYPAEQPVHSTLAIARSENIDNDQSEGTPSLARLSSSRRSFGLLSVSADSLLDLRSELSETRQSSHQFDGDYAGVYAYLTNHDAFGILTHEMDKLVEREFSDRLESIRHRVLLSVGRNMEQYQHRNSPNSAILITGDWDVRAFLKSYYDNSLLQDLGSVITVSGHESEAYLTTVRGYLQKTWPDFPLILLSTVQDAVSNGFCSSSVDGMENNSVIVDLDQRKVVVTGSVEFIVVLAQQLAWMVACCRTSSADLTRSHVFFCEDTSQTDGTYPIFDLTTETTPVTPGETGDCWTPLLRSTALATGFPIPERLNNETGLEIPLEIMACLGGTQVAVDYKGGYLLKGRSIMFVPVQRIKNSVQWHLFQKPKGRMHFRDVSELCPRRLLADALDKQSISQTRAFLGWCPHSSNILATEAFNYSDVGFSNTKQVSKSFINLVGGSLGFQYFGAGNLDFAIGKGTAPFSAQSSTFFSERLDDARQIPVILQDMSTRRAWQTDGERAILQLLLHRQEYGLHTVGGKKVCIETVDVDEAGYVRKTMLHNADTILTEDYRVDTFCTNFKLFKDAVYELCDVLEGMQAHLEDAQSAGMRMRIDRNQLIQGYEYMHLVHRKHRIPLKEKLLFKTCGGWPDFARDIEAVVLFGTDFGEVIQPTSASSICERFKAVPRDRDYLTIEGATLHELFVQSGASLDQSQLTTTGRKWHHSLQLFEPCPAHGQYGQVPCECQRIQTLLPGKLAPFRRFKPPGELPPKSAAIFGRTSSTVFGALLGGPTLRAEEDRISCPLPMAPELSIKREQSDKKSLSWHEWRTKQVISEASTYSILDDYLGEESDDDEAATNENLSSSTQPEAADATGAFTSTELPLLQNPTNRHNSGEFDAKMLTPTASMSETKPKPTKSFRSRIADRPLPWSQPNVNILQDEHSPSTTDERLLLRPDTRTQSSRNVHQSRPLPPLRGVAKEPSMPAIAEQVHIPHLSPPSSRSRPLYSHISSSSLHMHTTEHQPRSLRRKPNFASIPKEITLTR